MKRPLLLVFSTLAVLTLVAAQCGGDREQQTGNDAGGTKTLSPGPASGKDQPTGGVVPSDDRAGKEKAPEAAPKGS